METNNINNNKNDNNHDIIIFNLKGPALKPYGSPVLFQQWSPMPLLILLFDLNNFIISIAIPFLETFVFYKKAFCILGYSVIPCLIKDILPFCGSTDPLIHCSSIPSFCWTTHGIVFCRGSLCNLVALFRISCRFKLFECSEWIYWDISACHGKVLI